MATWRSIPDPEARSKDPVCFLVITQPRTVQKRCCDRADPSWPNSHANACRLHPTNALRLRREKRPGWICARNRLWRLRGARQMPLGICGGVFFAGLVTFAERSDPIPSRTRPSNAQAPMVLCLKTWESRSSPGLQRTSPRKRESVCRASQTLQHPANAPAFVGPPISHNMYRPPQTRSVCRAAPQTTTSLLHTSLRRSVKSGITRSLTSDP